MVFIPPFSRPMNQVIASLLFGCFAFPRRCLTTAAAAVVLDSRCIERLREAERDLRVEEAAAPPVVRQSINELSLLRAIAPGAVALRHCVEEVRLVDPLFHLSQTEGEDQAPALLAASVFSYFGALRQFCDAVSPQLATAAIALVGHCCSLVWIDVVSCLAALSASPTVQHGAPTIAAPEEEEEGKGREEAPLPSLRSWCIGQVAGGSHLMRRMSQLETVERAEGALALLMRQQEPHWAISSQVLKLLRGNGAAIEEGGLADRVFPAQRTCSLLVECVRNVMALLPPASDTKRIAPLLLPPITNAQHLPSSDLGILVLLFAQCFSPADAPDPAAAVLPRRQFDECMEGLAFAAVDRMQRFRRHMPLDDEEGRQPGGAALALADVADFATGFAARCYAADEELWREITLYVHSFLDRALRKGQGPERQLPAAAIDEEDDGACASGPALLDDVLLDPIENGLTQAERRSISAVCFALRQVRGGDGPLFVALMDDLEDRGVVPRPQQHQ